MAKRFSSKDALEMIKEKIVKIFSETNQYIPMDSLCGCEVELKKTKERGTLTGNVFIPKGKIQSKSCLMEVRKRESRSSWIPLNNILSFSKKGGGGSGKKTVQHCEESCGECTHHKNETSGINTSASIPAEMLETSRHTSAS